MNERGTVWAALVTLVICVPMFFVITGVLSSPTYQANYTSRYQAYQAGETAREQAIQQTRRVQAQQWGDTLRTWGMWGGGALAVTAVAGVGGWAVVRWQEERTRRHGMTEQRRVILA
jgi:hypothetical protein